MNIKSIIRLLTLLMLIQLSCTSDMYTEIVSSDDKLSRPILDKAVMNIQSGEIVEHSFKTELPGNYDVGLYLTPQEYLRTDKSKWYDAQYRIKLNATVSFYYADQLLLVEEISWIIEQGFIGQSLLVFKVPDEIPLNKDITLKLEFIRVDDNILKWYEKGHLLIKRVSSLLR